ncbi:MAG: cadmium-translocating P-type ATPase [Clostridia bacterium]|nr:cadmium-translocating P-type ATPase [Clostridia bacterium]
MKRKEKRQLIRIILSSLLLAVTIAVEKIWGFPLSLILGGFDLFPLLCYLIPYIPVGYTVLYKAARNIAHGQVFDENFLMSIATVGAFATGEYAEAVFVMLFYQVGELFEHIAVGKSRSSIKSLLSIRADTAFVENDDGELCEVECEDVRVGDIITVKAGGKIPLDGVIIEGQSSLNTVALTGESLPRPVSVGDEALSGCINEGGILRIRVTKLFSESTVSKILALVESSAENKSKSEDLITRFARIYTPAVVVGALLLALLPPMVTDIGNAEVWREWVTRAMTFLVISCPCALVISVPLSYFGGIGSASRRGILIKGSSYLDALSRCDTVVFDKTGTLTEGVFKVTDVKVADGETEDFILSLIYASEKYSTHPIALAIRSYCDKKSVEGSRLVENINERSGFGIHATLEGKILLVGNARMMQEGGISVPDITGGAAIFAALDGKFLGCVLISDTPKANARESLKRLYEVGIKRTVMLTGDRKSEAESVASFLSLDAYHAELLPSDKVSALESEISDSEGLVAYVGDGINDAPVLARADVGIAMGALGSDAAIEAADIVLMDDKLDKISDAILLSRRTRRIVVENIIFALAVKALALILGALGVVGLGVAIFADVGVAVIAILNSMRNLKSK